MHVNRIIPDPEMGCQWQLNKGHEERKHLKRNTYFKLAIVAGDVILATAFGATYMYVSTVPKLFSFPFWYMLNEFAQCHGKATAANGHTSFQCDDVSSKAAILEWAIAYGLNLYFLTLAADLWPAWKSSKRFFGRAEFPEKKGRSEVWDWEDRARVPLVLCKVRKNAISLLFFLCITGIGCDLDVTLSPRLWKFVKAYLYYDGTNEDERNRHDFQFPSGRLPFNAGAN